MAYISGELKRAGLERLATDPVGDDALDSITGRIYWNTTDEQVKLDDGTNEYAMLRNDEKVIIGNSGTASQNIRLYKSANNKISFVNGNDTTAEDTRSDNLCRLEFALASYTTTELEQAPKVVDPLLVPEGTIVYDSSVDSVKVSDGSSWQPVGSGSGASVITNIPAGEEIPAGGRPVYLHKKASLRITSSNQAIHVTDGTGTWTANVATGYYLLDTTDNITTLRTAIKTALDAASDAYDDDNFTVSFSESTRKFTLETDGDAVTWDWDTTTNTLGDDIGYDTGPAKGETGTSAVADNTLETVLADDTVEGTTYRPWAYQTYTDDATRSSAFLGWVVEASDVNLGDAVSVYTGGEKTMTDGTVNAEKDIGTLYTASASIIIDSSNADLDFKEDAGAEENESITQATYTYPYTTLCADIKTQLEKGAAGNTYTVTYSGNTDKISIATSGTSIQLLLKTGTNGSDNSDTHAGTILGFDDTADTSAAATITSDNRVDLKGRAVNLDEVDVNSVSIGISINKFDNKCLIKRDEDTTYEDMVLSGQSWLDSPTQTDFGEEIQFHSENINDNGYGIRVMSEHKNAGHFIFQYTSNNGNTWTTSSTATVSIDNDDVGNPWPGGDEFDGYSSIDQASLCFMDPDDNLNGVICLSQYDNSSGGQYFIRGYHTVNGGADFNEVNSGTALMSGNNYHGYAITISNSRCLIITNRTDSGLTTFHYSKDTGSGYGSFSSQNNTTANFDSDEPMACAIQYFPGEVADDRYRLYAFGTEFNNSTASLVSWDIDDVGTTFSSEQHFDIGGGGAYFNGITTNLLSIATDGNRVNTIWKELAGNGIHRCDVADSYNGGTPILDAHSAEDITPDATKPHELYNGDTAEDVRNMIWNIDKRQVLIYPNCYALACMKNGTDAEDLYLMYTTDFDTDSTWDKITLYQTDGTKVIANYCLGYMSSANELIFAFVLHDDVSSYTDSGTIEYGRVSLSSGVPTLAGTVTDIDGGFDSSVFQGTMTMNAFAQGACVTWQRYDSGDTYDSIYHNRFL